jgi:hypothetical protein
VRRALPRHRRYADTGALALAGGVGGLTVSA